MITNKLKAALSILESLDLGSNNFNTNDVFDDKNLAFILLNKIIQLNEGGDVSELGDKFSTIVKLIFNDQEIDKSDFLKNSLSYAARNESPEVWIENIIKVLSISDHPINRVQLKTMVIEKFLFSDKMKVNRLCNEKYFDDWNTFLDFKIDPINYFRIIVEGEMKVPLFALERILVIKPISTLDVSRILHYANDKNDESFKGLLKKLNTSDFDFMNELMQVDENNINNIWRFLQDKYNFLLNKRNDDVMDIVVKTIDKSTIENHLQLLTKIDSSISEHARVQNKHLDILIILAQKMEKELLTLSLLSKNKKSIGVSL